MRAFVVRPFGTKEGIDFDHVETLLIQPALEAVGIKGTTTAELAYQGNIRADMFEQLLKADLVVADMSIHNANVFYELGVRHALRDRFTFLIRCNKAEVPFDLRTDRYLEYDPAHPKAALPALIGGLQSTLGGERTDSPVFQLVPGLQAQDWTRYLVVPEDFTEEVAQAAAKARKGDLDLLAAEVEGFDWEFGALKQIGRELFNLGGYESARRVWERVVQINEDDPEAWSKLPVIYQRLGDLTSSELALDRVLALPGLAPEKLAELYSLRGSNEKTQWIEDWRAIDDIGKRREAALTSPHLARGYEAYQWGFSGYLNHFYSGLNALAALVITTELADSPELAEAWSSLFENDKDAQERLAELRERRQQLAVVVRCSIEAARARAQRQGERDVWTDVSLADLRCITGQPAARIARAYAEALTGKRAFNFESVRRQLNILVQLRLMGEGPSAAIEKLDELEEELAGTMTQSGDLNYKRILVFTGHMVDEPSRANPRFPPSKEQVAREQIRQAVQQETEAAEAPVLGIAGGACGGDILFHEVCADLKIPTRLFLALPPEKFVAASVQRGGPEWVERLYRLCDPVKPRVLAESTELPRWLRGKQGYDIWQRNNVWLLHNALVHGGRKVTLIALWDGGKGDGPGGTEHMVQKAQAWGAKFVHLDTRKLLTS